jgi:hypothetical protein
MFAAVAGKVALSVAVDVQAPRHAAVGHGLLADAGEHGFAPPLGVSGKAYIDGNQLSHWKLLCLSR